MFALSLLYTNCLYCLPTPSLPCPCNTQAAAAAREVLSRDNTNFNYAACRIGAPQILDIENISNYELQIHGNIICDYCY